LPLGALFASMVIAADSSHAAGSSPQRLDLGIPV